MADPLDVVRARARGYDQAALLQRIGDARLVLLGEATHGTHEFYKLRSDLTKALIAEHGFDAVAIEGDWPDAYRVNRYVRGDDADADAEQALRGFQRFPTWMWRNADVLDLVGWMRAFNDERPMERRAGFYGLDLYSLYSSIDAVLTYLRRVDPEEAARAAERYACFEVYEREPQSYGYAVARGLAETCEEEAVRQLVALRQKAAHYAPEDGFVARDQLFYAEQNARLVYNAEAYYRAMYRGRASSWNLRDRHMADTLDALLEHLGGDHPAKLVVWAHNSHLGDARATELSAGGELNVGQLVRERHGRGSGKGTRAATPFLVGFTTYTGTVTAASAWDGPAERKRVRPALRGSWEALFHHIPHDRALLDLHDEELRRGLAMPLLERAIGVLYRPDTERQSHYFHALLVEQFDAVIHVDETRAVEPLERLGEQAMEPPETYPSGL